MRKFLLFNKFFSGYFAGHLLLFLALFSSIGQGLAQENGDPLSEEAPKTISMDFEAAALKDVLKIFSQQSGLNFVASQEVESKKVTVFLEDIPVQDALNALMTANGLRYEQKEGSRVFTVHANDAAAEAGSMETRVFHIKHMRLSGSPIDVGGDNVISDLTNTSELSVASSGSSGTGGSSTGGSGASSSASASSPNASQAQGVDKLVESLLSKNGKVTFDLQSNSLVVTDTPEKLMVIEKVLQKLDVPARQVMLEVYLMEVKKDALDNQGIEWAGADGKLASFTAGSRTTAFPFAETLFNASKGVKASAVTAGSTLTLGTLSAANLTATLHYLMTQTDSKILARPRVLTLNNQAANIKLVTNAAIANTSTTTTAVGTAAVTNNVAERTQVGITLKMTPQVNEDESVELFLQPSVTTVAASGFFPTIFLDPTTRSVRTVVRVKNHETLVIGGLIDSDKSLVTRKLPFLGDIPLLGKAFRYEAGHDVDRELLIFITPHIVEGYNSLAENSATTPGRELAVKRMSGLFKKDQVKNTLNPVEEFENQMATVLNQQKALVEANAKHPPDPKLEKEMNQALDSFNQKNIKPNR